MAHKKKRSTCIVELRNQDGETCFLIAKQKGDQWDMLPGGRVEHKELPLVAAARELEEETTLKSNRALYLFSHESQYTMHYVFLLSVENITYQPKDDVESLWLLPLSHCEQLDQYLQLSRSTRAILEQYLLWRSEHEEFVNFLSDQ